ncbi:unannotated protein [freshwater metagenome]|uniref:Unannotated protein n=1 Tax=freshwater metagenome TaxID=449393 RepID=A0A6J5YFV9_9ZZZZ
MIHRRNREVALLGAGLVGKVRAFVGSGVPLTLDGVDHVERAVRLRVEAHVIEHEELGLGTEERGIGDTRGLEIGLGLLGDITRVTGVALVGDRIGHVAVDDRGLVLHERVDVAGVRIGDEHHVRFLNLLETTNRGAVETVALGEVVKREHVGGNGDVLHDAGKIDESKIDELAAFGLDVGQNFFGGAFLHGSSCMGCDRRNRSRVA